MFWAQIENPLQRRVWQGPRGDSGVVLLTCKPLGQTKLEGEFIGPSSPFQNSLLALGCVPFCSQVTKETRETNGDGGTRGDREESNESCEICLSLVCVGLGPFLQPPLHQFNKSSKESEEECARTKRRNSCRKGREENFKTQKRRVGVSSHETPSQVDDRKDGDAQGEASFARPDREGKE